MRHRRRRGLTVSVPFVLAMFGIGVAGVGLLGLSTALYLTGAVAHVDEVGTTTTLLMPAMATLYDNGMVTVVAGGGLFLGGTVLLLR